MRRRPKDLLRHELIGLGVEVVGATNRSQIGIRGKVADETRNTLVIDVDGDLKRIPKRGSTFIFTLPRGKRVKVDGNILEVRPEDRIEKRWRKW
ncbi:MAG: ribonuclease P protein subunit [Candidatus Aenigmatarchaeota archaeon]|nr:MAG: ribonuclease P protein subunit [Candidatus Aenigmarchaeota archaeon]